MVRAGRGGVRSASSARRSEEGGGSGHSRVFAQERRAFSTGAVVVAVSISGAPRGLVSADARDWMSPRPAVTRVRGRVHVQHIESREVRAARRPTASIAIGDAGVAQAQGFGGGFAFVVVRNARACGAATTFEENVPDTI